MPPQAPSNTGFFWSSYFFDAANLQTLYKELLGLEGHKPFECVGTPEETVAAFILAHRKGEWDDTAAMQYFLKEALPKIPDPDAVVKDVLTASEDHVIPAQFMKALPKAA